ncbi:putative uracil phosphoribosyltransferase urg2 [Escovopsis weberi]|uniref:uracil phosphoribosyltransferase n=1 Tax=Escovopsis weberi TaxID=150374 RepID=A0A0M8N126_ESCWE|nr:putative uracil phosphoribosyltransferase urg2 [Escovopsis weberi]
MSNLPENVHVSQHPSLRAKLSQLRSKSTSEKDVKSLIHDVSLIIACEALSESIKAVDGPKDQTPLGYEYTTTVTEPGSTCIVPILRSGLAMVDAVQTMLPKPVPVHHLGLYREPTTLDPVEYYNKLPYYAPSDPAAAAAAVPALAVIVDPVIATGGTCSAAINTLREWGVKRVIVLAVIGAESGVQRAASEWADAEIWIAGVDRELTPDGMLKPGLGDIGDRLFST